MGKDRREISPEKRREIASLGGLSVPPEKRSFSKDPTLASAAGQKGGTAVPAKMRSFSLDRQLASDAGRRGGLAKRKKSGKGSENPPDVR